MTRGRTADFRSLMPARAGVFHLILVAAFDLSAGASACGQGRSYSRSFLPQARFQSAQDGQGREPL